MKEFNSLIEEFDIANKKQIISISHNYLIHNTNIPEIQFFMRVPQSRSKLEKLGVYIKNEYQYRAHIVIIDKRYNLYNKIETLSVNIKLYSFKCCHSWPGKRIGDFCPDCHRNLKETTANIIDINHLATL